MFRKVEYINLRSKIIGVRNRKEGFPLEGVVYVLGDPLPSSLCPASFPAFVASPARYGGFIIFGSTQSKAGSSFPLQGYRARCKLPHIVGRRWETAAARGEDPLEKFDRDSGAVLDEELQALSQNYEAGAFVTL